MLQFAMSAVQCPCCGVLFELDEVELTLETALDHDKWAVHMASDMAPRLDSHCILWQWSMLQDMLQQQAVDPCNYFRTMARVRRSVSILSHALSAC